MGFKQMRRSDSPPSKHASAVSSASASPFTSPDISPVTSPRLRTTALHETVPDLERRRPVPFKRMTTLHPPPVEEKKRRFRSRSIDEVRASMGGEEGPWVSLPATSC
jgi:hypothetical protein